MPERRRVARPCWSGAKPLRQQAHRV